jgi:glycosyltransferase involved in cell wall biosynthesis
MRNPLFRFAHRHIWQRLPRNARRAALLRGSEWLAPRITPEAEPAAPIIVVGPLRAASGLGEGARVCHDALKKAGLPVYGIDLSRALLNDVSYNHFIFEDGRHIIGSGTLFLHVGGPFVPLALLHLGRKLVKDKRIVAHWVWELPEMPAEWRLGIPFVHEIWAPSRFAAKAIGTIAGNNPVHVLPHPLDPPAGWPQTPPTDDERPFTVLVILNIASSFERKNPCAAIKSFRRAFGDDANARLIVKHVNAFAYPPAINLMNEAAGDAPNIMFVSDRLDAAGVDALYAQADVVLSLHRAEGFGLVVAEGMLRGIPVVATDWSGNTDFLTPETGMPVDYILIPAHDPQDTYEHPGISWAEANIEHAAEALRTLRADPDFRLRLGKAGRARAIELFSPKSYGERVKDLLALM